VAGNPAHSIGGGGISFIMNIMPIMAQRINSKIPKYFSGLSYSFEALMVAVFVLFEVNCGNGFEFPSGALWCTRIQGLEAPLAEVGQSAKRSGRNLT
jgi:hypothetical protein